MKIFKALAIITMLTLIKCEEMKKKSLKSPSLFSTKQKRHLKRLLRLHGGPIFNGKVRGYSPSVTHSISERSVSMPNIKQMDNEFPSHSDRLNSNRLHDMEPLKNFFSFKKTLEISVSANDEEIYANTADYKESQAFDYDTDEIDANKMNKVNFGNDDFKLDYNHLKSRTYRSVPTNVKRQFLKTSLRRINQDPRNEGADVLNETLTEAGEVGHSGNITGATY